MGKQLVKELKLDSRGETISRWMAFYISEQITIAKNSIGIKKKKAERNCFEAILKLWKNRTSFPDGKKPFLRFEAINQTLENLNPENISPFYFSQHAETLEIEDEELKSLLNIAEVIDEAARVWFEQIFLAAIKIATTEETKTYLENALNFKPNDDIRAIVRFIDENADENETDKLRAKRKEKLINRIQQLDRFIDYSDELKRQFEFELQSL